MRRTGGFLVLLLALFATAPVSAQTILCDPLARSRVYPSCGAVAIGERLGRELAAIRMVEEQGIAITSAAAAARARFRAALPDKPDRASAEQALSQALDQKDAWYYTALSPGGHRLPITVDGGIPVFATNAWVRWIDGRNDAAHLRYVFRRNWIEFAEPNALGRDPDFCARYVIAMTAPWSAGQTPGGSVLAETTERQFLDRVAAYTDDVTKVFGRDALLKAGQQLLALPKLPGGEIAAAGPPQASGSGLVTPQDPWVALLQALGASSPKNAVLALLLLASPGSPSGIESQYAALAAKYGEQRLQTAGVAVNRAPRTISGAIADPRAVGGRRRAPMDALEDSVTATPPAPAAAVGADYLSWKEFPVGRSVLFAESWWTFQDGRAVPESTQEIHLRRDTVHSIDAGGLTVARAEQRLFARGTANDFQIRPIAYLASGPPPAPATPGNREEGQDTVTINGTTYRTRWVRASSPTPGGSNISTNWYSDEVPGGLLMWLKVHPDHRVDGEVLLPFDVPDLTFSVARQSDTALVGPIGLLTRSVEQRNPEVDRMRARISVTLAGDSVTRLLQGNTRSATAVTTAVPPSAASVPLRGGETGSAAASMPIIPARASLVVGTVDTIDQAGARANRTFKGRLEQAVMVGGRVVVPQGADVVLKAADLGPAGPGRIRIGISVVRVVVDGMPVTVSTNEVARRVAISSGGSPPITITRGGVRIGTRSQATPSGETEVPAGTRLVFAVNSSGQ
jgi:hypothetical protein